MADEIVLGLSCEAVVSRAVKLLNSAGLQVIQSFDLRTARLLIPDCACPHHGTAACDCEYIVLLIYRGNNPPLTLIVHGYDNYSWLLLADSPGQDVDSQLAGLVSQILSSEHVLAVDED